MYRELQPSVAAELLQLGSVQLRCCPGETEALYTLPKYGVIAITQPSASGGRSSEALSLLSSGDRPSSGSLPSSGGSTSAATAGAPLAAQQPAAAAPPAPAVPAGAAGAASPTCTSPARLPPTAPAAEAEPEHKPAASASAPTPPSASPSKPAAAAEAEAPPTKRLRGGGGQGEGKPELKEAAHRLRRKGQDLGTMGSLPFNTQT